MSNLPPFLPTDIALPYGLGPDGNLVSINHVARGLACACTCPGCGAALVAKKGDVIRHHFAHATDEKCATGFESMLHLLAKDILAREQSVTVPEVVVQVGQTQRKIRGPAVLPLSNVRLEQWLDGIRPDIIADFGAHQLIIEIAVTHKAEPQKIMELERRGSPAIEINLSEFHRREVSEQFLRDAIFQSAPRIWLFNRLAALALPEVRAEEEQRIETERQIESRRAEDRASLAAEWARWEEDQAAQREWNEQKEAERDARYTKTFNDSLERALLRATQAMEGSQALKWVEKATASYAGLRGKPDGEVYGADFEAWCGERLRRDRVSAQATESAHRITRESVLRAATAKLKSREKADLWMTTNNPKAGGRPFDVCVQPGGIDMCKAALR